MRKRDLRFNLILFLIIFLLRLLLIIYINLQCSLLNTGFSYLVTTGIIESFVLTLLLLSIKLNISVNE